VGALGERDRVEESGLHAEEGAGVLRHPRERFGKAGGDGAEGLEEERRAPGVRRLAQRAT
jgi:hypothetical protein